MSKWYKVVTTKTPITQGDLIFNCPVTTWKRKPINLKKQTEVEALEDVVDVVLADVIVMTQACDLEHNKVQDITLCAHYALSEYKNLWASTMQANGQNPTEKAWIKTCENLKDGYIWNQTLLNNCKLPKFKLEHRVVEFYQVYTIPKTFLESLVKKRKELRVQLLPPYREYLSQAFARFYMRVGLPTVINKVW